MSTIPAWHSHQEHHGSFPIHSQGPGWSCGNSPWPQRWTCSVLAGCAWCQNRSFCFRSWRACFEEQRELLQRHLDQVIKDKLSSLSSLSLPLSYSSISSPRLCWNSAIPSAGMKTCAKYAWARWARLTAVNSLVEIKQKKITFGQKVFFWELCWFC